MNSIDHLTAALEAAREEAGSLEIQLADTQDRILKLQGLLTSEENAATAMWRKQGLLEALPVSLPIQATRKRGRPRLTPLRKALNQERTSIAKANINAGQKRKGNGVKWTAARRKAWKVKMKAAWAKRRAEGRMARSAGRTTTARRARG